MLMLPGICGDLSKIVFTLRVLMFLEELKVIASSDPSGGHGMCLYTYALNITFGEPPLRSASLNL